MHTFNTSFSYTFKSKSSYLDIIMHGGSKGIESPFIQKIFSACEKLEHSALAFNFPYKERGEDQPKDGSFSEELEILEKILEFTNSKNYKQINIIGKSLGGIIASRFLQKLHPKEMSKFSVTIFGCVVPRIDLGVFSGKIIIIQGEKDKFGKTDDIKRMLGVERSKNVSLVEISGADHSFREENTHEPIHEDIAIKEFVKLWS